MFKGGDILEANFKHPTLGSGTVFVKSGEDSNFDPGGYRSNDDANMITGDGQMIDQVNRVRWFVELVVAWDMITTDTVKTLSDMGGSTELADWTFTHINGKVYGGKGKPVGDVQGNGNTAQTNLKVAGGGKLEPIN